jgi:hypothetical protein
MSMPERVPHMPQPAPTCYNRAVTTWTRSSFCASGNCAEARPTGITVLLRNSQHPEQPPAQFDNEVWKLFLADVRDGKFNQW